MLPIKLASLLVMNLHCSLAPWYETAIRDAEWDQSHGRGALDLPLGTVSTPLERAGRAFFGEGAGGFLEVLRQVKLQGRGLHRHFALELVHVPAAGADGGAHRERRVPRDFGGELVGGLEVAAFRRDAVDDAGGEGLLGGEEAAGQGHLGRKGGGAAEIQQGPVLGAAE